MRKTHVFLIGLTLVLLASSLASASGTIKARAAMGTTQFSQGKVVEVPIEVDLSALPEKLGSFTATLEWDATVLQLEDFANGYTEGFGNAVVNQKDAFCP